MIQAVIGDPFNKDAVLAEIINPSSGCGLKYAEYYSKNQK